MKKSTIKISSELKQEIEYYLSKSKDNTKFDEFVDYKLKQGLQDLILETVSKLEHSKRCGHLGKMVVRRVYKVLAEKDEYLICEKCSKDKIFDGFLEEEKIQWGDWNPN